MTRGGRGGVTSSRSPREEASAIDVGLGSPAVWRRLVLVGSSDHRFYAFDAGTGDVRWQFDARGPISGSASVIDGLVYFSTFAERTYALDAATGRHVKTWPDGKYSPVVVDAKRLYLVGLG